MPREEPKGGLATIRRKMGHFSRDNARSRQIRLRAVLARIPDSSCIMQALLLYSRPSRIGLLAFSPYGKGEAFLSRAEESRRGHSV